MKILLLVLFLSISCVFAQTGFPITVTDDTGREVTFERIPTRVVVLREELLEILVTLGVKPVGYGGRVAAPSGDKITDHPYLAREVLGTPTYVGSAEAVSLERVVAIRPDLILFPSDGGVQGDLYGSLSQIAPTLAFDPQTRGSWQRIAGTLGTILGQEARAAKAITSFAAETDALRVELAAVVSRAPRAAVLYLPSPSSTWVLGRDFALGGLIEVLGFKTVQPSGLDLGRSGAAEVSVEALANLEADTVFTVQLNEGVQEGFQVERLLAGLGVPIVRLVLDGSRPYTGPISEQFYLEQLRNSVLSSY